MFQFALATNSSGGQVLRLQAAELPASGGLESLLDRAESEIAGLSGEMQSLLMQMTPEMLRRIDELMSGGMGLPQAANRLLGELELASSEDFFAGLLKDGLSGEMERMAAEAERAGLALSAGAKAVVDTLKSADTAADDLLLVPAAQRGLAGAGTGSAGAQVFPTQLTGNLLHMGVPQPVASKGWEGAIADRVMWMAQGEQQFAKLKLNPPNLGPIEVRVSINHDQTSVSFLAQHAAVREALESALPRLREMFEQQSMDLVRAEVSDPGFGRDSQAESSSGSSGSGGRQSDAFGGDGDELQIESTLEARGRRLVDLFA